MSKSQTRRQALYFPAEMLADLQREAARQDRSISWLVQQAWRISRGDMKKIPSTTDYSQENQDETQTPRTGTGGVR
jgi:uncharacterized small protein (TIGR04563 family)